MKWVKSRNLFLTEVKNLNGCDVSGSLKNMKLKHLEIIFSTNSNDSIEDLINGSEFESLTISSDILGNERNKLYINSIKSKVSIKGPII